jgi:hypothetical protein
VEEAGVRLGVDGEVGAAADEVRDQLEIAADEARLAAELLLRIGHVTRYPSPSGEGGWRISHGES